MLQPKRDQSRPALYSINFIYQRDFVRPVEFAGLNMVPYPSKSPGAIYDLNFFMVERSDGWRFSCEYNIDLYDAKTINRMIAQMRNLLEQILANPDRRMSEFSVAGVEGDPLPPFVPRTTQELKPERAAAQTTDLRSNDSTENKLVQIWQETFKRPEIGKQDDFFEIGGYSLLAVRLLSKIEESFGIELSLNALFQYPTIEKLASLIDAPMAQLSAHHLVPIQTNGTKTPFFWIPGGRAISVLALREVSLLLGPDQPVYGLESRLPRSGERFATVEDRASRYIELIKKLQPSGPYQIAGFCTGGMVAYEMARQLQLQGEKVSFLGFVQAWIPSHRIRPLARFRMSIQRISFLINAFSLFLLARVAPKFLGISVQHRQAMQSRFGKFLSGWMATAGESPDSTQIANIQVMNRYRPGSYNGKGYVFIAEDCYESAGISRLLDPRIGWRDLLGGQCEIYRVPGDHVSLLTSPNAEQLAEAMKSCIERSQVEVRG
jgi:thioesterase domain-containing protein/acyl carrier protein